MTSGLAPCIPWSNQAVTSDPTSNISDPTKIWQVVGHKACWADRAIITQSLIFTFKQPVLSTIDPGAGGHSQGWTAALTNRAQRAASSQQQHYLSANCTSLRSQRTLGIYRATRQYPVRFINLTDLTVDMPHYVMTQDGLLATMGGEMAASTEDQNISSSQESGAVLIVESIPLI